jgi:hypothetical protein
MVNMTLAHTVRIFKKIRPAVAGHIYILRSHNAGSGALRLFRRWLLLAVCVAMDGYG